MQIKNIFHAGTVLKKRHKPPQIPVEKGEIVVINWKALYTGIREPGCRRKGRQRVWEEKHTGKILDCGSAPAAAHESLETEDKLWGGIEG